MWSAFMLVVMQCVQLVPAYKGWKLDDCKENPNHPCPGRIQPAPVSSILDVDRLGPSKFPVGTAIPVKHTTLGCQMNWPHMIYQFHKLQYATYEMIKSFVSTYTYSEVSERPVKIRFTFIETLRRLNGLANERKPLPAWLMVCDKYETLVSTRDSYYFSEDDAGPDIGKDNPLTAILRYRRKQWPGPDEVSFWFAWCEYSETRKQEILRSQESDCEELESDAIVIYHEEREELTKLIEEGQVTVVPYLDNMGITTTGGYVRVMKKPAAEQREEQDWPRIECPRGRNDDEASSSNPGCIHVERTISGSPIQLTVQPGESIRACAENPSEFDVNFSLGQLVTKFSSP